MGKSYKHSVGWIKSFRLLTDGTEVERFIITAFSFEAWPNQW